MNISCQLFKSNESKFWQKQNLTSKNMQKKRVSMNTTFQNLRNQIDTRDWDLRRTLEGYTKASQAKDRLQQEVADRALQKDRLRGFQEIEATKKNHEFYVDGFSRTKLQENQHTINNLMDIVREIQCEMNYVHDSENLKDAESVHSGQLSHVASDSESFLPQNERGDLFGRAKNFMPPNIWNTPFTSGDVFYKSTCTSFVILHKGTHTIGPSRCRKNSREDQYGAACN